MSLFRKSAEDYEREARHSEINEQKLSWLREKRERAEKRQSTLSAIQEENTKLRAATPPSLAQKIGQGALTAGKGILRAAATQRPAPRARVVYRTRTKPRTRRKHTRTRRTVRQKESFDAFMKKQYGGW